MDGRRCHGLQLGVSRLRISGLGEEFLNKLDRLSAACMIPDVRLPGMNRIGLNHAVGRVEGTQWPAERGNIRPAAHRDGFFPGPKQIKIGDTIELRTRDGKDIDHQVHLKKPGNLPGFLLPSKFDLNLKFLVEVAHRA